MAIWWVGSEQTLKLNWRDVGDQLYPGFVVPTVTQVDLKLWIIDFDGVKKYLQADKVTWSTSVYTHATTEVGDWFTFTFDVPSTAMGRSIYFEALSDVTDLVAIVSNFDVEMLGSGGGAGGFDHLLFAQTGRV